MAVPRQKFREIVFLLLYSQDMASEELSAATFLIMDTLAVTKKVVQEAQAQMALIWEKRAFLDGWLEKLSHSYAFERIQRVERNILRLGLYELWAQPEIPFKVVIAEAMRLCRKFSTPEAAFFVNALLDGFIKINKGENVDPKYMEEQIDQLIVSEEIAENASKEIDLEE